MKVKGEAPWAPIPDQPMQTVAVDIFSMPEVQIGKEVFDCVVLCVDRHSGYIVAILALKKGVASQGGCSNDDSSLADHLQRPPHHLQQRWTPVHWRLVQGYVFPDGDTACQECRLSQTVNWPG